MFFRGPRDYNHLQGQFATGNNAKTKKQAQGLFFCFGATDQIRTGDLLITNQLLYRLSHSSMIFMCAKALSIITKNKIIASYFARLSKICSNIFRGRQKVKFHAFSRKKRGVQTRRSLL